MELWIRSQDKEDLIKVDNLGLAYLGKYNFVDKIGDIHREEYHICQFEENCHTTLGYYKTKERAIEVLDEIEKLIKPITIFQNCQVDKSTIEKIKETGYCMVNNDARVEQISQVFYQMPEK